MPLLSVFSSNTWPRVVYVYTRDSDVAAAFCSRPGWDAFFRLGRSACCGCQETHQGRSNEASATQRCGLARTKWSAEMHCGGRRYCCVRSACARSGRVRDILGRGSRGHNIASFRLRYLSYVRLPTVIILNVAQSFALQIKSSSRMPPG